MGSRWTAVQAGRAKRNQAPDLQRSPLAYVFHVQAGRSIATKHHESQPSTAKGMHMRKVYLICYDVCDAKRLRKVYKTLKGAGDALQYSVFRCELTAEEKQDLLSQLWEIINPGQDRLLFANLGPVESRGLDCLEYWGEPREQPDFTRPIVL